METLRYKMRPSGSSRNFLSRNDGSLNFSSCCAFNYTPRCTLSRDRFATEQRQELENRETDSVRSDERLFALFDRRVHETITRPADHTRCGSRLANVTRISESSPRLHRAVHSNGVSNLASSLAPVVVHTL